MRVLHFLPQVTNYRKDGSTFKNLLVLIPVRDSTSVFRFCVGLQCEFDSFAPGSIANATLGEGGAQEDFVHWASGCSHWASGLLESFPDIIPVQYQQPQWPVLVAPGNSKLNAGKLLREAIAGALLPCSL